MKKFIEKYKVPIILIVGVIAVWFLSAVLLYDKEDRGSFGDMFGGVNALFSGLAFAGVIYAIYPQRSELELQREELGLTRKELQGQKIQMEHQNKTLLLQRFESTFFELLKVHLDIVNLSEVGRIKGRPCFPYLYNELRKKYISCKTPNESELNILKRAFKLFHELHTEQYFGNALNILSFIEGAADGHDRYVRFYISLLSSSERALLFYYSLSREGEKFGLTCKKLSVFGNARLTNLINENHASLNQNA